MSQITQRNTMTTGAADCGFDGSRRGPAVLVVDDEVLTRIAMSEELRRAGYTVIEAGDAHEALAVLGGTARIDLVVTDLNMPGGLSGGDLVELIRADFPAIKVVMVSGQQPKEHVRELLHGFLSKPVSPAELIGCLRNLEEPESGLRAS